MVSFAAEARQAAAGTSDAPPADALFQPLPTFHNHIPPSYISPSSPFPSTLLRHEVLTQQCGARFFRQHAHGDQRRLIAFRDLGWMDSSAHVTRVGVAGTDGGARID
mmetsp:Transcript_15077/g.35927  ORF Transcript_15077/g.35927 Transcript_15077/m.35927 type:complete len:107 (-) Transcript_15077:553-873(-)